jgi:hypothetical protein
MIRKMKLRGRVTSGPNGTLSFSSTLHDGTPVSLNVTDKDVQINEDFDQVTKSADAWLMVTQQAQQDYRCYIILPKPSLQFGKYITVKMSQLSAQTPIIEKLSAKLQKPEVVEEPKPEVVEEPKAKKKNKKKKTQIEESQAEENSSEQKPIFENIADKYTSKWKNLFGRKDHDEN